MARKRDVFDFFRANQHRLNEAPSAQSWRRLYQRLDAHRRRNRISRYRVLGMVAGILFLAVLVGLISLSLSQQHRMLLAANKQAVPSDLEDLTMTDADPNGLRTVLTVQRAQEGLQHPISEGAPGQKLVFAGSSEQRRTSGGATLDAFSWMVGRWQSHENGQPAFEEWNRLNDNELAGMAGLENEKQPQEHMRLYKQGNKIYFSTDFGGQSVIQYSLIAINGEEALFENLEAGFPQQLRLQRPGQGRMAIIYQNAESHLPDTERIRNLHQRHTIKSMQAVRRMSRVNPQ